MRTFCCVKSLFSVAVLSLVSLAAPARGGLVEMTDNGNGTISGFSPQIHVSYAESFTALPSSPPTVLQGITFIDDHLLTDSQITATQFYHFSPNTVAGSYISGGPGSDTAALVAITNSVFYPSPGGLSGNGAGGTTTTILLNDLQPSTTYQLDAFVGGVVPRAVQITIDGTFANGGTPSNSTNEFDDVVTFTTGPMETSATAVFFGSGGPLISGLVVSTNAPEPSSLALAGVAAAGLIFVARRRHRKLAR